jgi:hypothetical protein
MNIIRAKNDRYLSINFYIAFILFLFVISKGQERQPVLFEIDMSATMKLGLFAPEAEDIVIIRGSFNNWSGNDYYLSDTNKDSIYEQTFRIEIDTGTVSEFKYLIVKPTGPVLWEKFPNPVNPSYGNRIVDIDRRKVDVFDIDRYHLGIIGKDVRFSGEELRSDFMEFRKILEQEHCCFYEYTKKEKFDSLFEAQYRLLNKPMSPIEFYKILTPITAKIGCGHTAVWMPEGFWLAGLQHLFPLKIHFVEDKVVVENRYNLNSEVERGSILHSINGVSIEKILNEMRSNYSADAFNIHFINAQIERRFALIYARRFGFRDKFRIEYTSPEGEFTSREIEPAANSAVRKDVFSNFQQPSLKMELMDNSTAIIRIQTFGYYDKVPYFRNFIDSCFTVIKEKNISNLILDLRDNDGGDPFCAAPLFSYLQKEPRPYFAEPYGKYADLAKPLALPENHFTGNLYTLIDGRCFSTSGHFCALLKYHRIGKFIGTPGGASYKCNAGKSTQAILSNTGIMLYFGRSTFAAAVKNMDKARPIMPDYLVHESYQDFLANQDVFMDKALGIINKNE